MASASGAPLSGLAWVSASAPSAAWTPIAVTPEGTPAAFGKGGFGQKGGSFHLCFTTSPSQSPAPEVLADLLIVGERSALPPGFTYIPEFLPESKAAISKKKRVCAKLVPLGAADTAVFDIKLTGKSKVVPGYMRSGDIGGFAVWCRKEHVFKPTPLPKPRSVSLEMKQLALDAPNLDKTDPGNPATAFGSKRASFKHSDSIYDASALYGISAMEGVPFSLHPGFEGRLATGTNEFSLFKDLSFKSLAEIEREYDYGFVVERTAAARLPPSVF